MRRIASATWTNRTTASRALGCGVAVIATGLTWWVQWRFGRGPEDMGLLMSFFISVGLAGWVGGFVPAMLAAVLALLIVATQFVGSWHPIIAYAPLRVRIVVFSTLSLLAACVLEFTFRQRLAMARHAETVEAFNRLAADFSYEWRADGEGGRKLTAITEGISRLTGYTAAELKAPGGWQRLLHPDDVELNRITTASLLAGSVSSGQQRFITRDGRTVWVEYRSEPLPDRTGRVRRIIGAAKEITAQKEAEEGLRRQMALLDAVNSSATDAIFLKDAEGRYVYGNRACCEWVGVAEDALRGKTDLELMPDSGFAATVMESDRRIMATGREEVIDETCHFTRRTTIFQTTKAPWRDARGRIVGVAGVARDITVHKALEDRVAEDDRRKEEFIAVLAHELRNPLAPLVNGISLLAGHGQGPANVDQTLASMSRQITVLTRLVDDMLDVAHINRGKMDFAFQAEDLDSIIGAAVDAAQALVVARAQTVSRQRADTPVSVRADRVRLTQAITNLINNASKFSPKGATITLRRWTAGQRALVAVSDCGPGVPPGEREKIFELFNRGTDGRKEGGLGIGLALVRHIVEAHEGKISVGDGADGQGATFTIELATVSSAVSETPDTSMPTPVKEAADASRRRVLIVDDNRDAADSLVLVLQSAGYETRVAYDGETALRLLQCGIDVAVLDLGMPDMDGLELARRIRASLPDRAPALIALSGWAREADQARSREAGFALHFAKPVEIEALLSAIAAAQPDGSVAPAV